MTPGAIGSPKTLSNDILQRREKQRTELADRVFRLVPEWAAKVSSSFLTPRPNLEYI